MPDYSIEVQRTDLANTRVVDLPAADSIELAPGTLLLNIDKFALTANNITYGVAGDSIGYWQFFPAADGWGRIPVWGMATVIASETPGIEPGQRFYGYFPMSSYLVVKPEHVTARGFVDGSEHRAALPKAYNQYSLISADNGFAARFDNHQMLYRPLFTTSFVLDDFFSDNQDFGAEAVVLSSASSKTAFGLAFQLKQRGKHAIGLTSARNRAFVEGLGLYDQVVTYDEISQLDNTVPSLFVDMAGNGQVLAAIHAHFQDQLKYSCRVGITHWEAIGDRGQVVLPGPAPEGFFAPSQMQKRNQEWGPEKFQATLAAAWNRFADQVDNWVTISERQGEAGLLATYQEVLQGAAPDRGMIVEL